MKQSRRTFIARVAGAGIALPLLSSSLSGRTIVQDVRYPVRLFSKPIDSYEFGFMCDCLVQSGIAGFDLTVRPGGKVEPSAVETDLPRLVEEAGKYNLLLDMMVTGILSARDPMTEKILKNASATGIKYYRLGWYDYEQESGIVQSINSCRNELEAIAGLNRKYGITGGYQNHSGTRVGGPVWDIDRLLDGFTPDVFGCQYDVRHASVEGANTWILGMNLIADHINSLAIKDFTWLIVNGRPEAVTVPLGEGIVKWDLFFSTVKRLNISAPITLHVEYPLLSEAEESLTLLKKQEIIAGKLSKDMDFLRSYLVKYNLT